jgi:hypothetical protein
VFSAIVRLMGIGSIIACTIVIAAFAIFAVNQTSTASSHQQHELNASATPATPSTGTAVAPVPPRPHESSVRKAIDDASKWLTSPFAGLSSGWHSEWAVRGVDLVLALFIYGFCAGFLTRMLRVRV